MFIVRLDDVLQFLGYWRWIMTFPCLVSACLGHWRFTLCYVGMGGGKTKQQKALFVVCVYMCVCYSPKSAQMSVTSSKDTSPFPAPPAKHTYNFSPHQSCIYCAIINISTRDKYFFLHPLEITLGVAQAACHVTPSTPSKKPPRVHF